MGKQTKMAITDEALQEKFSQRAAFLRTIGVWNLDLHVEVDDRGIFEVSKTFPLRKVFRTGDYNQVFGFIEGFRMALDKN